LDCPVDKIIRLKNKKYKILTSKTEMREIDCDHIIIAIPPPSVQKIKFTPKLSV